jgi:hypothetical protein
MRQLPAIIAAIRKFLPPRIADNGKLFRYRHARMSNPGFHVALAYPKAWSVPSYKCQRA